jgi:enoyl-CoA hydratase/carnithine racemase
LFEITEGVARVTINRPERRNAMSYGVMDGLRTAMARARADESIRVVVLTGAGDKAFSAGMDLKERAAGATVTGIDRRHAKTAPEANTPTKAVAAISKPTIAAINGYAVGGGLELALACDLRIAATDAKLGLAEVRRGIIPGAGGTQRLARVVGLARALELGLSGRLVEGAEAFRIGLVHEVVAREELLAAAERLAETLLKGAPLSLRFIKEAIRKGFELPLEEGLRLEADLSALIATTEDAKEGPRAFAEKRPAVWKGK